MAEEFVRKEHVDEYVLRMDERFIAIQKRLEQGFAPADKPREQDFVHINYRFDSLEKRMDQIRAGMLQMRNWLVRLFGPVVFAFIASIVLILFRDLISR